jgi:hypothetical protein
LAGVVLGDSFPLIFPFFEHVFQHVNRICDGEEMEGMIKKRHGVVQYRGNLLIPGSDVPPMALMLK